MILQQTKNSIERFNVDGEEGAFTIEASPKAFKLLTDSLYSNKILACIRELTCNIFDSHLDANKQDVPFEIHLPTRLEPWFSVKDFGVGLSDEFMMTKYTRAFHSTKNNSNNTIGGLGLGRLSAFCYSDSYTVTSRFEGVKRVYSAFINEIGIPSIVKLSEEDTNENNGLEVSLAVKQEDFDTFGQNAKEFLARVEPKPIFIGKQLELAAPAYAYDGTGWKVRKNDAYGHSKAIMGIVAYPITIDEGLLTEEEKVIVDLPIDIPFDIGELDVAASREALSFNKISVVNLKVKLNQIYREIKDVFDQKFQECQSLWEARVLYKKLLIGELSCLKSVLEVSKFLWNGQPIHIGDIKVPDYFNVIKFEYIIHKGKVSRSFASKIPIEEDIRIFNTDIPRGGLTRIRKFVKEEKKVAYLINFSKDAMEVFLDSLGMKRETVFPGVSTLPKPIRARGTITDKGRAEVLELSIKEMGDVYIKPVESWYLPDEEFDLAAGGIYVEATRYDVNGNKPRDFWYRKLRDLELLGINVDELEVYGFKKKTLVKVQTDENLKKNWIKFEDYLKEKVAAAIQNYSQAISDYKEKEAIEAQSLFQDITSIIDSDSPFWTKIKQSYNQLKQSAAKVNDIGKIQNIISRYNLNIENVEPTVRVVKPFIELLEKFPMIKLLWAIQKDDSYYGYAVKRSVNEFKEIINNYVRAVEETLTA